jgi:2TM domain
MEYSGADDKEVRDQAVANLKRKRDFNTQVLTWMVVSVVLTGIWAATGTDNFFWPVFPIAGWALGLVIQGWNVFGPGARPISESDIERESDRLRR